MIRVENLQFSYGPDFRLAIENLQISPGERLAIVGPSGSGKTTLLSLLAGILPPSSGRIQIGDTEVTRLSSTQRRAFRIRHVGLVFQEFELIEYLTTLDNILLPFRLHGSMALTDEVRQRAVHVAQRLEVDSKLHRFPQRLSQGERQRVAICRAVIGSPSLILADEPTGNLDPLNKGRVLDLLMDVVNDLGCTLITVTHDHDLLDRFDRVIDFGEFFETAQVGSEVPTTNSNQKGL